MGAEQDVRPCLLAEPFEKYVRGGRLPEEFILLAGEPCTSARRFSSTSTSARVGREANQGRFAADVFSRV